MTQSINNKTKKSRANKYKQDAIKAAGNDDYLSASFNIAQALKLFMEAGDKMNILETKKLSVEFNKNAEKQMQVHEFKVNLDTEVKEGLEAFVTELTKANNLCENLERISKSQGLVPRLDHAQKNAKEIVPVTAQLLTHLSIGDEGHLASLDNFESEWLATHYNYQLELTMRILNNVYSKLALKNQFNENNIMRTILSRKILGRELMLKFQTVLERRFACDYLSAIHILVPLIEKTFMSLSGLVGLDNIALNNKKVSTRNAMLSSNILQSEEYKNTWGSDFCKMIDFFLLDADGHRFRHKLAHGDITVDECNFTSFNLLFYVLVKQIMMIETTTL